MNTPMREHPHLPTLTIEDCLAAFAKAGVNFNQLAKLTGFSRMAVYWWRSGRSPLPHSLDRVSTLAHKALAAVDQGHLPLPRGAKIEQVRAVFDSIELTAVSTQ